MNDQTSVDEAIEAFILASMEQGEHDRASKDCKERKDELAARIMPFIEEQADDGQSYEVLRGGKPIGKLNVQQSTSYVLSEGVSYDDLVANGLMERRKKPFVRWYPAKEKPAKKARKGDELTDEEV